MERMNGVDRIEREWEEESVKDQWVVEWPNFMWIHAIVHKLHTQQSTRSCDWLRTVRIKVSLRCKSQRLSMSINGVFPISQVSLDCLMCPAKLLFHPMSIQVDPNHFSAFPAFFPSFPTTCPNLVPADQWLICCAYSIPVLFVIITLFSLSICTPADCHIHDAQVHLWPSRPHLCSCSSDLRRYLTQSISPDLRTLSPSLRLSCTFDYDILLVLL